MKKIGLILSLAFLMAACGDDTNDVEIDAGLGKEPDTDTEPDTDPETAVSCAELDCKNGTCVEEDGRARCIALCEEELQAPENGSVVAADNIQGSEAHYSCDEGYTLSHEDARVCGADGAWSGEAPSCVRVCEEELLAPRKGSVTITGTTVGSEATYSCAEGYKLSHENTRVCGADGEWDGTAPTCEFICEPADLLLNGSFESGLSGGAWELENVVGDDEKPIWCNSSSCPDGKARTGVRWLRFYGEGGGASATQRITVPEEWGTPLRLVIGARAIGDSYPSLFVAVNDPYNPANWLEPFFVDSGAYKDYIAINPGILTPGETVRFYIMNMGSSPEDKVDIDDVRIECIEPDDED